MRLLDEQSVLRLNERWSRLQADRGSNAVMEQTA